MGMQRHDYFAPDSFGRAVQDCVSDDVMRRLRDALGGQEIKLPRKTAILTPDHWLVKAVGHSDAVRLCEALGGEQTYIPLPVNHAITSREEAFFAAADEGLSNKQIAVRFSCSDRHVRRVLARSGKRNPVHSTPQIRLAPAMVPAE